MYAPVTTPAEAIDRAYERVMENMTILQNQYNKGITIPQAQIQEWVKSVILLIQSLQNYGVNSQQSFNLAQQSFQVADQLWFIIVTNDPSVAYGTA